MNVVGAIGAGSVDKGVNVNVAIGAGSVDKGVNVVGANRTG